MDLMAYVDKLGSQARAAARELACVRPAIKNDALNLMADRIVQSADTLAEANGRDLAAGQAAGLSAAMLDRLELTDARIRDVADGLRTVASLVDPVGEVIRGYTRPNGLRLEQVRVPIGVVCMIYESRPNVTADAASLCLKSGNACILRGGKEAIHSNIAIHKVLAAALTDVGINPHAIQLIETTDRKVIDHALASPQYIDVVIPRGGEGLIRRVVEKAKMPVIKHYKGVCHVYVDEAADLDMARRICVNAKVQRPGTCNALETLLVHEAIAGVFLPRAAAALRAEGVEIRGCDRTAAIVPDIRPATEEDWSTEYLDLILSVKVVTSMDEAIDHIATYGSAHTDAIVTEHLPTAEAFVARVDSACVFVNVSTRLSDGGEFGLGAEIGISTDKLHARGPMGLRELTSYKWVASGPGILRT